MFDQQFRATITIEFEDLTREGGKDRGNKSILITNEVSAESRQLMQNELADTLKRWGENWLESKQENPTGTSPGK